MNRLQLVSVFFALVCASCFPLDPLGDSADRDANPLSGNTFSGGWHLSHVRSSNPPFGDIDSVYLDGELPETVGFDIADQKLTRHRVLLSGELKLQADGRFLLGLQFGEFTAALGSDVGPTGQCNASLPGYYTEGNGILRLTFDHRLDEQTNVFEDGVGLLRMYELPVTCSRTQDGQQVVTNVLLSDLIFSRF